ncbi:uncharacterized protein L969DRAFT_46499 [Mixia osmundae IAM 14324]|uniref:Cytochrome P450 n=1 Tax=Mixia osmundae (strain CBS 9802 / IAM 14324 / JCM 22182 / KY 12970) TaxID=764103 RepID=G7E5S4_MIXOS|nr:uncharacterized protein L969DRAFT_46499 [Mixia osmundae IAM 14324]KEI40666.1 hypothetical protein L969DRAFT_46499 [Mixia osmundae IAM 14324]GAA98184.1 hypothetical protein E5Q_04867 [Mixia osmundae IAM 14324]
MELWQLCLLLGVLLAIWFLSSGRMPAKGGAQVPPMIRHGLPIIGPAIALGKDPMSFLAQCQRKYGNVFTLPLPRQTFVIDAKLTQHIYGLREDSLSFQRIRVLLQGAAFGVGEEANIDPAMRAWYYPLHSKLMSQANLPNLVDALVRDLRTSLLAKANELPSGGQEIDLVSFVFNVAYDSTAMAIFGPGLDARAIQQDFLTFDDSFPLLVAGIPIWCLPKINRARKRLLNVFEKYALDEEAMDSASDLIRELVKALKTTRWSRQTMAAMIYGEFWAALANVVYVVVHNVLFCVQSPGMVGAIRAELHGSLSPDEDGSPSIAAEAVRLEATGNADRFPALTSACWESIRLFVSAASIRVAEVDVVLSASKAADEAPPYLIKKGTKIVCVMRPLATDESADSLFGSDAKTWKGIRHLDSQGRSTVQTNYSKLSMSFGGGVSKCEGRYFAAAELQAITAMILLLFDIEVTGTINAQGKALDANSSPHAPAYNRPAGVITAGFDESRHFTGALHPTGKVCAIIHRRT